MKTPNNPLMSAFFPEQMMRRAELQKAQRQLRRLDALFEQSRRDDVLPKREQKGYDHFRKLRQVVWDEMDVLGSEVWRREAGLERYSVIHVVRENMEFRIQVLKFSFMDDFGPEGRWAWVLEGRKLRKDGTLGVVDGRAVFRHAHVQRRHLDGGWRDVSLAAEGDR